jgi:hypothetical protein
VNWKTALLWVSGLLLTSCSGLSTLTPQMIDQAEKQWNATKPPSYQLVVTMSGDRLEKSEYDVHVENGVVTGLTRNGKGVNSFQGQDYSMDGLFRIIREEMDLSHTPGKLGAPEGYTAYLMAEFDSKTGRLLKYRRSVGGGVSNTIDIVVQKFEPQTKPGA